MKLSVLIRELEAKLRAHGDCEAHVMGHENSSAIEGVSSVLNPPELRVVIKLPQDMDVMRTLTVKKMSDL